MPKIYFSVLFTIASYCSYGQGHKIEKESQKIAEEGKLLYRSEMASWHGSDIFVERYKGIAPVGGYFSYVDGGTAKCIFYSKGDAARVIATISFDKTYAVEKANTDFTARDFTNTERLLYSMRTKAMEIISADTFFKSYPNSNFNIIPIVSPDGRKVYVLTGPNENGVMLLGNDYQLTFDENNNLRTKKALHSSTLAFEYNERDKGGAEVEGAVHSHLSSNGELITPTDICTLMLYSNLTKWKHHWVISTNYVSMWNCETNELQIITREELSKMENQKSHIK